MQRLEDDVYEGSVKVHRVSYEKDRFLKYYYTLRNSGMFGSKISTDTITRIDKVS